MDDYRIFVGAFPEGEFAERILAVRTAHDAKTARITAPHVTLAGTYWRKGSPVRENESHTIEQLCLIEGQLQPFELQISGVETFLPHNLVIFLHIEPTPNLLAVRRLLVQAIGSDKHRNFTPHLTLTMRLDAHQTETLLPQLRQTAWLKQPMNIMIDHLWLMQRGPHDPAWRYIHRVEMRA